jgi:hypothetical protein
VTLPNLIGHRHSARTQSLTTILKLGLFAALLWALPAGHRRLAYLGQGRTLDASNWARRQPNCST